MKRILFGLLGVVILYLLSRWIYLALVSEETRIRWLIEGMAEDFNNSRPVACADGLADDFREETSGARKDEVRAFLLKLFLTARDPKTKEFLYRVEVPRESIEIVRDPGGAPRAQVKLEARFHDTEGGATRLAWEVRIQADLEKEAAGWKVKRSRHQTLRGKALD